MRCVDDAVLTTLGGEVLREQTAVMAILEGVFKALSPPTRDRDMDEPSTELGAIDREPARLSNAIAAGGELMLLAGPLQFTPIERSHQFEGGSGDRSDSGGNGRVTTCS